MNRNKLVLTLASAGALAVTMALIQPDPPESQTAENTTRESALRMPTHSSGQPDSSKPQGLPGRKLLDDVDILDGLALRTDGTIGYTLELRHLFDHFLSMGGSAEHLHAVREALAEHLQERTTSLASQDKTLSAFDRYVEYLRAAEQVELSSYEAGDLERTFEVLFSMRRSILGNALAEAFFAEDEAREQLIAAQRRVAADPGLGEAERNALYAELEESLPTDVQDARREATAIVRLNQDTATLRAAGASDAAIYQLRAQLVGYQAAERLAELDRTRAQWSGRLEAYHRERKELLSSGEFDVESREEALTQLREQLFTENEARRVAALDRTMAPARQGMN